MLTDVVQKTMRVPAPAGEQGDGAAAARQLDAALASVGFKCSAALFDHLSELHPTVVHETGRQVLAAVRELVGDDVEHNTYFIDFPDNVPDTEEFWLECIVDALLDPSSAANVAAQVTSGTVNLLDLPKYGRYQHSYEEMLEHHEEFIASAKDRVTVLELGGPLHLESHALYLRLASNIAPLSEADVRLLAILAELHLDDEQPESIPVRESRAVINRARLEAGHELLIDTPVDVLRLAVALSDGDVSLNTRTKLRSLKRSQRRALMVALDAVIADAPYKLGDVNRYNEVFKRLGERLHPHEFKALPHANDVFSVARGEKKAETLAGQVEVALNAGEVDKAVSLLSRAPGLLLRSVDRLARNGASLERLAEAVRDAAPKASLRVLLSLREHLLNRDAKDAARIFVNQEGRAWVTDDEREPLEDVFIKTLGAVLDDAIAGRLPEAKRLVIDPEARGLALPLTEKNQPEGIGIVPRGSVTPISKNLRFFVHWQEKARCTDYDLSVILLDENFGFASQVSYTKLNEEGLVHSGDIVEAPAGASEFIDIDLAKVDAHYIVPQINVYSGEGFDEVETAFFGFMERSRGQQGKPFEPRAVRAKSDLFGTGRVALPAVFYRNEEGEWEAKWMHLVLNGHPRFNATENNRLSTSHLARAIIERRYLQLPYIEELLGRKATSVTEYPKIPRGAKLVTFIGLEKPEDLPEGSTTFTTTNLGELLSDGG